MDGGWSEKASVLGSDRFLAGGLRESPAVLGPQAHLCRHHLCARPGKGKGQLWRGVGFAEQLVNAQPNTFWALELEM